MNAELQRDFSLTAGTKLSAADEDGDRYRRFDRSVPSNHYYFGPQAH
jgi:hypothetical protein